MTERELIGKLNSIRVRARLMLLLYGVGLLAMTLVASFLLPVLIDWAVRLPGVIRAFLTAGAAGLGVSLLVAVKGGLAMELAARVLGVALFAAIGAVAIIQSFQFKPGSMPGPLRPGRSPLQAGLAWRRAGADRPARLRRVALPVAADPGPDQPGRCGPQARGPLPAA